ncbi:MAG: aminoglycoside 6-adenylyltransferase [Caldilineaceae bacterium]
MQTRHVPEQAWPDPLQRPTAAQVAHLLTRFWQLLQQLPDLLHRQEQLLADHLTTELRSVIIEMMLALNGIHWPSGTRHLNGYLSASQRAALEKTLVTPAVSNESWIGRAVALVVIYRWYAPQLVNKFSVTYPQPLEEEVWSLLQRELPDWPLTVTTD